MIRSTRAASLRSTAIVTTLAIALLSLAWETEASDKSKIPLPKPRPIARNVAPKNAANSADKSASKSANKSADKSTDRSAERNSAKMAARTAAVTNAAVPAAPAGTLAPAPATMRLRLRRPTSR